MSTPRDTSDYSYNGNAGARSGPASSHTRHDTGGDFHLIYRFNSLVTQQR